MDPSAFCDSQSGGLVWAPGQYWAFVPHPLPPDLARNRVYRADEVLRGIDEPLTRPENDWLNDSEEQMQFIGNLSAT